MSDSYQKTDIIGNNNSVMNAVRDINIGADDYFFTPNLESFSGSGNPKPKDMNLWMASLFNEQLLFLSFEQKLDDLPILLNIAYTFTSGLEEGKTILVKQRVSDINFHKTVENIHKTTEPTLFILSSVTPQDVKFNIEILKKYISESKNYIIIATYLPITLWRIPQYLYECCYRLDIEDLYEEEALIKFCIDELGKSNQIKRNHPLPSKPEDKLVINYPLSTKAIVLQLATPENIKIFIRLLESKESPDEKDITNYIEFIQGNEKALENWYLKLIGRDQMIALGLSLFQGIFDDQFFLIFRTLVDKNWHWRDETLRSVNHKDIQNLSDIFILSKTKTYGRRLGVSVQGV